MQAIVIDIFSFCQKQEQLEGQAKVADFERLSTEVENVQSSLERQIHWKLQGGTNQLGHPRLQLQVWGELELVCQRCLTSMTFSLDSQSEMLFARSEDEADEIEEQLESWLQSQSLHADEETFSDVVVGDRQFDISHLIEDEVLLGLPQAPKHEESAHCPSDWLKKINESSDEVVEQKVSPFAALRKLNS